jgi:aconitate hydratase
MTGTVTEKIINAHHVSGQMSPGEEIALRIDQTLTQDATGTMAYLQFEAIGVPRVRTELSVSYVDHNTLQGDFRNADDHRYLQSVAQKFGVIYSRPGNGICHQLHLERFARPGKTLIGSDSHTPTAGGIGAMAMGAGGLDVAAAMAGLPFRIKMPRVMGIELRGALQPWVSAKDVILEVLRRLDVGGGIGYVLEYFGEGVKTLSVTDRATITNMGTETGATTSIFPSDDITRAYLEAQGRGEEWVALAADPDVQWDKTMVIDLDEVVPLAACPHSPGIVRPVSELSDIQVSQVAIGSCTNSSLRDMKVASALLRGKSINNRLHLMLNPGSRQVVSHLIADGDLDALLTAGARLLENACGACIGMGGAPASGSVSVRTYNRNFPGRSGTPDAQVYLVSPETAAATAVTGHITDPRSLDEPWVRIDTPKKYRINDNGFVMPLPADQAADAPIVRGPNIAPLPEFPALPEQLRGTVLLKLGDKITTDHIMPAGAKILPLRSNIPEISKHVFASVDPTFAERARASSGGFIIGGDNYGQGSSREHAALAPKYLGVLAVIVKSFARIHLANLVNFGIVPLTFDDPTDYDNLDLDDELTLHIGDLSGDITATNHTRSQTLKLNHALSQEDAKILKSGGLLPWIRTQL